MTRRADEWNRDEHPPYCTCQECTQRRLSMVKAGAELSPQPSPPSRNPRRRPQPINRSKSGFPTSLFLLMAVLLAGIVGAVVWFGIPESDREQIIRYPGDEPLKAGEIATWVMHYTNKERKAANMPELIHDPAIGAIATGHSENMVQFGMFHEIQGKDPTDRALDAGYTCEAQRSDGSYTYGLSENIYEFPRLISSWDTGKPAEYIEDSQTLAQGLVEGWMNSPGHKENILDPFARRIGVGIAIQESQEGKWIHETVFATQNFSECR